MNVANQLQKSRAFSCPYSLDFLKKNPRPLHPYRFAGREKVKEENRMPKLLDALLAPFMIDCAPHARQCALASLGMWMAKFGGRDPVELLKTMHKLCPDLTETEQKTLVVSVAEHDLASLQLACEVIASADYQQRISIINLMCAIAIDDGYLTISEHEFLLFLTRLLRFQPNELESAFKEVSGGCPLPELPQLDDVSWWQKREGTDNSPSSDATAPKNIRLHDLGLLGLDEGATKEEIRKAYVRLVKIHHPDKYQILGEEAMREAGESFSRIKAAYERLTNA